MFRTMSFAMTAAFLPLLSSTVSHAAEIPARLSETRALDGELDRFIAEARKSAGTLDGFERDVRAARQDVEKAIQVTTSIRRNDERLRRLIRQLRPYESIPKVRTAVQVLARNLREIQTMFHKVRTRTDSAERNVLRPTAQRLRKFEGDLREHRRKILAMVSDAEQARTRLSQTARIADSQNAARRSLEHAARAVRPRIQSLSNSFAEVNSLAANFRAELSTMRRGLASFWTVQNSLAHMDRQLKPAENTIGQLDRVLSRRVEVKLFTKTFGFSVREVLETPGKIAGPILRPIESQVERLLQPLLNRLNIRIDPPKGLDALLGSLTRLTTASNKLEQSLKQTEEKLTGNVLRSTQRFQDLLRQPPLNGTVGR
ncbi:MAG: hypothetical protein EA424_10065 [Planctomycetaceae bacterium]|nr:MAG: hypothetical protein EA424_10065 [Planctomycetaceae bacterium]